MCKKVVLVVLSLVISIIMLLVSCTSKTTTTTSTTMATPTPSATTTSKPVTTTTSVPATTSITTVSTTPKPTAAAKWWDKFGTPTYGGTVILRRDNLSGVTFDPLMPFSAGHNLQFESLFCPDWTLDRSIWPFQMGSIPDLSYYSGLLAEKWELTDPLTFTVHLRQGVKWQNKAPVNGREFTADDVVYTFDRLLGTGNGFTQPNMFWAPAFSNTERVIATDKYTIQFKFKVAAAMSQFQAMAAAVPSAYVIIPREWAEQANVNDWKNQAGTGPWIVADYVQGSQITFNKNPDYYGHDERYPQNQIPYLDTFKELAIPDEASTLAALRTGKIDMWAEPYSKNWQQAKTLADSNPEVQVGWLGSTARAIELRCDQKPCSDIRVRKAMQMTIDIPSIAKNYYGGYVDGKPCGIASPALKGWVTPYDEWPADMQAEYSYNIGKARSLMTDASYPNGFNITCTTSSSAVDLLQIMQASFKEIGINMEISVMEGPSRSAYVAAGKHQMYYEQYGFPFSVNKILGMFKTGETQTNYTYNNDAKFDAMIDEFNNAATIDQCKEIFKKADYYSVTQHWAVVVCPTRIPIFWQPRIKGYSGEITIGTSWLGFDEARWWVGK